MDQSSGRLTHNGRDQNIYLLGDGTCYTLRVPCGLLNFPIIINFKKL